MYCSECGYDRLVATGNAGFIGGTTYTCLACGNKEEQLAQTYEIRRPCGNCHAEILVTIPVGKMLISYLENQENNRQSVTCPNCGCFGLNHLIPVGNI